MKLFSSEPLPERPGIPGPWVEQIIILVGDLVHIQATVAEYHSLHSRLTSQKLFITVLKVGMSKIKAQADSVSG
jgi:hypothetical protein